MTADKHNRDAVNLAGLPIYQGEQWLQSSKRVIGLGL